MKKAFKEKFPKEIKRFSKRKKKKLIKEFHGKKFLRPIMLIFFISHFSYPVFSK